MHTDTDPSAARQATPTVSTDIVIIGAGPVGLFAAFQAGVLGLSCQIVEALDVPGGQCIELYPDKPIFDIPALPVCTARDLIERLLEQAKPFGAPLHLGQRVEQVERQDDGQFMVTTALGFTFHAAAVLLTGGNGAFVPQRLAVDDAITYEGRQIHYAVRDIEALRGQRVAIAGGGDSALDWALALRDVAKSVSLIHRRDHFRAADASVDALRRAIVDGTIDLHIGTIAGLNARSATETSVAALSDVAPALDALRLSTRTGETPLAIDHLLVLYGLVAALGPIETWGLKISAGRCEVDPHYYQTSIEGIYAAGDIAGYTNKQKLILSGFHEAALALRHAYQRARPTQKRMHIHSSYDARLADAILGPRDA